MIDYEAALSPRVKGIAPSGIRKFFDLLENMDSSDAISLGVGEPDFVTPWHIRDAGVYALEKGFTKYTPNAGIRPLRVAIADKLWRENGIACDPDKNLIVTGGATQALMLAMVTLVNPGDEVILQGPNWPDYKGQIDMVNGKAVNAAAGHFRTTFDNVNISGFTFPGNFPQTFVTDRNWHISGNDLAAARMHEPEFELVAHGNKFL